jgi:membrane-bound lytic murein transglycosylase F
MKKETVRKIARWSVPVLILALVSIVLVPQIPDWKEEAQEDAWTRIRERGQLVALTDKNSLDYFIYRGEPMGYQLELLRSFADYIGVSLRIISSDDVSRLYRYLEHNAGDVIACNLPFSQDGKYMVHFTDPLGETRYVLLQRKSQTRFISVFADFSGDTVWYRSNPFVEYILRDFTREIHANITLAGEYQRNPVELARLVSEGKIDYMICQENLALVLKRFYRNLDASLVLTHFTNYSWGVRPASDTLRAKINEWLSDRKTRKEVRKIYLNYYDNPKILQYFGSDYFSVTGGRLSPFDEEIRRVSSLIWWDWRLIASLVYEESNFRMGLVSSRNARGLMQLMPETAEKFGMDSLSGPGQQIAAGVKYLRWLDRQLPPEISNPRERICFILASYNVGIGRVLSAREKAARYGQDPNRWNGNVDYYLTRKSRKDPLGKNDTVADISPFGEAGGFVDEIMNRYYHYRNLIPR